jgi:hypothetical protein
MAVVSKPCRESNLAERHIGPQNLPRRKFNGAIA